jgi:hypothetical protein
MSQENVWLHVSMNKKQLGQLLNMFLWISFNSLNYTKAHRRPLLW